MGNVFLVEKLGGEKNQLMGIFESEDAAKVVVGQLKATNPNDRYSYCVQESNGKLNYTVEEEMSGYEIIPCVECGEQTIASRPTCNLCESTRLLFEEAIASSTPKSICPECGECTKHSSAEKAKFAQIAMKQAVQFDRLNVTRGASRLEGATITHVDARAINHLILYCEDGSTILIDSDIGPMGIPVILVSKR